MTARVQTAIPARMERADIVIVGSGHGGAQAAIALRQQGHEDTILMLSRDRTPPYERPPLSKEYLAGDKPLDRILIRPPSFWEDKGVAVELGVNVSEVDAMAREVVLGDGRRIGYRKLIWAGGGDPRRLSCPGSDLAGIHSVRHRMDVDAIRADLEIGARRAVVIGGGYIGLEAAAVARKLGLEVTLIEMADRILQRVAAKETADIMRGVHQAHGVSIREKTGLVRLVGMDGRVAAAELYDGSTLDVDFVIVGIGVTPNDRLARESGLDVGNGIVVDDHTRTSDSAIHAVGDCALLPWRGQHVRLESVQNAVDQAEAAAAVLTGAATAYDPKPWFWSDQYDAKLQIAGFNLGYDETMLRQGAREGSWSVWYFRDGRFVAVDAVNDAKAYVAGKKLLDTGAEPDRAILADASADLKLLLS